MIKLLIKDMQGIVRKLLTTIAQPVSTIVHFLRGAVTRL